MTNRLEYTTDQDLFFDFQYYPYTPAVPFEHKFRSVNLLYHSFDALQLNQRVFQLVQTIREAVGILHTVWGIKQRRNNISWEFYFYDYGKKERRISIPMILEAIKPFISCQIKANENWPYFVFSIDIDHDLITGVKDLEKIDLYIGNVGSSGICYSLMDKGPRLKSIYFFFDPTKQMNEVIGKVCCSTYIGQKKIDIDRIIWPELRNCGTIWVANKPESDCIYFSRIKIDQFLFFLKRLRYPGKLISFVQENKSKLDHLLYDVGFDYTWNEEGLMIPKSVYYGTF